MDRTIFYAQAQLRGFDLEAGPKDAFMGQATALDAALGGVLDRAGVFSGCGVTVNGLSVSVAAGYVLSYGPADATAQGSIAADNTTVLHQAAVAATTLTVPAPSTSAGQSAIVTIYSTLSQTDSVRAGDPTSGLLGFWNTADPGHMLQGPNNTGTTLPTVRRSIGVINYAQGAAAATGSQVAPSLPAGSVPIAYIQWDYGDTSFTQAKVTQPNYLQGLLHSHHNGTPGQAPKILLTNGAEVQGTLPVANLPSIPGLLLNIQPFTSSGTYTPSAGVTGALVRAVGGGGSGGACPAVGTNQQATAGGGASGAYAEAWIPVTGPLAVVIGTGGVGPAAGSNPGNAGGTTMLGNFLTVPGGSGGGAGALSSNTFTVFPTGNDTVLPTCSIGKLLVAQPGLRNGQPQLVLGTGSGHIRGGDGGTSSFGAGGTGGQGTAGQSGTGFGAGGGGAAQSAGQAGDVGASGTPGKMIIYEYS